MSERNKLIHERLAEALALVHKFDLTEKDGPSEERLQALRTAIEHLTFAVALLADTKDQPK